ncbi:MAG: Flp pilus assembly complex ATPase component TadA [Deltaproteobacteria bacterium]|nr:Flp pilus assembly complex ATPase component TadA [Deltaproteobacteria bacterium]
MISLKVHGESHPQSRVEQFAKDEVSIGRVAGNDLVLANTTVSSHHARIYRSNGSWMVADQESTNGTFLNGERVGGPASLSDGDEIAVGEFRIRVDLGQEARAPEPAGEAEPAHADDAAVREIRQKIHKRLIEFLDLRWVDLSKLGEDQIRSQARGAIENILREMAWEIPKGLNRDRLIQEVLDEALGLGPLEDLLADDDVSEIMVNRFDQIYIERKGKLVLSDKKFTSNRAVLGAIERIVAPIGRRIDESSPMVDARLKDGSRVNAIVPPLALKGPSITIRKFNKTPLTADDLVRFGAMTRGMANFLKLCVELRQNIVVSGGTGSGKTTLLNMLSSFIPGDERIVTAEDSAELKLQQEHVVSLETRPPNLEGTGAVTIRDLVRNSLRMRPDRIVVGECRAGEALDMLQAMNTGHDGSMTTLHANSPRDALARMETLVLMAGMDLPVRAIREQMASAVNIILQQTRFSDGSRKVTSISEVTGLDGDQIQVQEIFYFKQDGYDAKGKVVGRHVPTGYIPRFYEQLRQRGLAADLTIFRSEEAS